MKKFQARSHMSNIQSLSSNKISDNYRDSFAIMYENIDNVLADTTCTICGRTLEAPIMVGPIHTGDDWEAWKDEDFAKAVHEAGSFVWTHWHNPEGWKKTLAAGTPGIRVMKPLTDMKEQLDEIAYDTEHGALGYAMDISHGLNPYGEKDGPDEIFNGKSTEDLIKLNEASPLPFFLKDVMSLHDAKVAAEVGCAGIILSGHNNRFPCQVPPLWLLPKVRELYGDKLTILVDGGITSGYEAFKALALGADGVLVARPFAAAYNKGGTEEVTYKMRELAAQLRGAMTHTNSPDLQHINRDALVQLDASFCRG